MVTIAIREEASESEPQRTVDLAVALLHLWDTDRPVHLLQTLILLEEGADLRRALLAVSRFRRSFSLMDLAYAVWKLNLLPVKDLFKLSELELECLEAKKKRLSRRLFGLCLEGTKTVH
jgi:hypothetical protein